MAHENRPKPDPIDQAISIDVDELLLTRDYVAKNEELRAMVFNFRTSLGQLLDEATNAHGRFETYKRTNKTGNVGVSSNRVASALSRLDIGRTLADGSDLGLAAQRFLDTHPSHDEVIGIIDAMIEAKQNQSKE